MSPAPTPFAQAIRDRMNTTGDTTTALAARLGVNQSTVARWLSGAIPETVDRHTLAVYLDCSPTDVAELLVESRAQRRRERTGAAAVAERGEEARLRDEIRELRELLGDLLGRIEDLESNQ